MSLKKFYSIGYFIEPGEFFAFRSKYSKHLDLFDLWNLQINQVKTCRLRPLSYQEVLLVTTLVDTTRHQEEFLLVTILELKHDKTIACTPLGLDRQYMTSQSLSHEGKVCEEKFSNATSQSLSQKGEHNLCSKR